MMVNDDYAYDYAIRNSYRIDSDEYTIDHSKCDGALLLKKALSQATGDYLWIYGNHDMTLPSFLESMLTIQRNIGPDVIITDFSRTGKSLGQINVGKVTVYHHSKAAITRTCKVYEQLLKFFRRSLITEIDSFTYGSLAKAIMTNAQTIGHYDCKMFVLNSDAGELSCPSNVICCSWEIPYQRLTRYRDFIRSDKISVTIGICAYNEQFNIRGAVESIFAQKGDSFVIDSIIIVSSGSTDRTDEILKELASEYDIVHPIFQESRKGKNSAVNEIIRNSNTDIVVIYNADNLFASEYSLDMLIRPFADHKVGVTGGHPIPLNSHDSIPDYTVQLMWSVHHFVSLQSPNIGELIAFRKTDLELPTDSQGDEGLIRAALECKGYSTTYVPEAMVYNMGPTNVSDFLRQRKRVNVGETRIREKTGFKHPTHNLGTLAVALLSSLRQFGFRPIKAISAVSLEYLSRLMARMYAKNHDGDISVWDQVKTTKKL